MHHSFRARETTGDPIVVGSFLLKLFCATGRGRRQEAARGMQVPHAGLPRPRIRLNHAGLIH